MAALDLKNRDTFTPHNFTSEELNKFLVVDPTGEGKKNLATADRYDPESGAIYKNVGGKGNSSQWMVSGQADAGDIDYDGAERDLNNIVYFDDKTHLPEQNDDTHYTDSDITDPNIDIDTDTGKKNSNAPGQGWKSINKLPNGAEPSGTVVQGSHLYTVSDEGQLYQTDLDGNLSKQWNLGNKDLESITSVPGRPGFVYLGVESDKNNGGRPSILEFDINKGKVSKTFNIPEGFPSSDKKGMEALVYNPDTGNFMAGSQSNNQVYSYKLDLDGASTAVTQQGSPFTAPGGSGDLSDMAYHDGQIYYLFDKKNGNGGATLASANAHTPSSLDKRYSNVNVDDQEGIAFSGDAIFLALDSGGLQWMPIKDLQ